MAALAIKFSGVLARNSAKSKLLSQFLVPKVEQCLRAFSTSLPIYKKEMLEITYETTDGKKFTVQGKEGDNLLDIVINNDVDLDGFGACEGTLACSTCHLIFKKEDFDRIEEPSTDEELDMLDLAYGLTDTIKNVSLAGCGFLALYLLGAIKCLLTVCPHVLKETLISGASAGALIGSALICQVPIDDVRYQFLNAAVESRKWAMGPFSPGFKFEDYLRAGIELLPPDAHLRANGRLFVSLTRVRDMSNVIISEWDSREDLVQTLRCACYILGASGMVPPTLRGEWFIDGGYSNRQPVVSKEALTISPYAGDADICPDEEPTRRKVSWANHTVNMSYSNTLRLYQSLMPPEPHILNQYHAQGYRDTWRYLQRMKSKLRSN
nr:patatin-like phospholipase domain-containing protein 2 isoform X2 [Penaeus vannamei]